MLTMIMPSGDVWGVPVAKIAENRAAHYAREFDGDTQRSLAEDTLPLFEQSPFEISDWAVNNMNWSDFDGHQVKVREAKPPTARDFQDAWLTTYKAIEELP